MKNYNYPKTFLIVLMAIVIATAVYALATWEAPIQPTRSNSSARTTQPASDLEVQSSPSQDITSGGDSSQLQQGAATQQPVQSSSQDIMYPSDPNPCKGYDDSGLRMPCMTP